MKTYILPLLMMMLISCSNSKTQEMKAQRYLCPKAKKSISPKTCEAWTCKPPKANGATTAWHVPKLRHLWEKDLVTTCQTLLSWKDIP